MICHVYRRGRFYWGKLQLDHEPRLSRFSLGTTDRRVAQANLLQIAKERQQERLGLLAPQSVREAAERPILALVDAFLAHLQVKGRAVGTLDKYRSNLTSCIKASAWRHLRDLNARSFCEWRAHSELSPKSVNDTLGALQSFCRWLVFQRYSTENPLALVERVDTRGRVAQIRRALTTEELDRLLTVAPINRRAVYLLAAYTGLRRAELKALRWSDVILESGLLRVRASTSKNRRDAMQELKSDLVAELRAYRPTSAAPFTPLFPSIPRLSTIRRDLLAAEIPLHDADGRRVDLHALRVTYGTNLVLSGADIYTVQKCMRHSDIKMTMKLYVDAGRLPTKEAVAKLPRIAPRRACS